MLAEASRIFIDSGEVSNWRFGATSALYRVTRRGLFRGVDMARIAHIGLRDGVAAGVVVAVIMTGVTSRAWAAIDVTDAVWSGENNLGVYNLGIPSGLYPQQPLTEPGTYTNLYSVVTTTGLPYPSISISVQTPSLSGNEEIIAVPQAELDYYFKVVGPGRAAEVDFTSKGSLTSPSPANTDLGAFLFVDFAELHRSNQCFRGRRYLQF